MVHASPNWQAGLLIAAVLFLLWEVWSGWRRGLVRAMLHFVAFVFSGFIGYLGGQAVAVVVGKFSPGYGWIAGLFFGSVITLGLLALTLLLSALLFKKTSQQPSASLRLLYGVGGAVFGLLTGLVILWGGISLIRGFGAIAESQVHNQPAAETPVITRSLMTLKESLELGPAGQMVENVDPVPTTIYDTITRVGRLVNDQDAMMRFLDYPGVQSILQSPKMAALIQDPEVARAAESRNFLALMQNPKLLEAVTDPTFSQQLTSLDLQKALDYALPPAQPSPSPQKKP